MHFNRTGRDIAWRWWLDGRSRCCAGRAQRLPLLFIHANIKNIQPFNHTYRSGGMEEFLHCANIGRANLLALLERCSLGFLFVVVWCPTHGIWLFPFLLGSAGRTQMEHVNPQPSTEGCPKELLSSSCHCFHFVLGLALHLPFWWLAWW